MATLTFYISDYTNYASTGMVGSGLGFYGSTFGSAVEVGEFQQTTFLTNSVGTASGQGVSNTMPDSGALTKVYHAAFGLGASVPLTRLQNKHAPINIQFTHGSNVTITNCKARIYDRNSIDNAPTGVNCYLAEVIRPNTENFATSNGSGDTTWTQIYGSSSILTLTPSPGPSGRDSWIDPVNGGTGATQHDWYLAIGASPNSIGSKLFALYFSGEYA